MTRNSSIRLAPLSVEIATWRLSGDHDGDRLVEIQSPSRSFRMPVPSEFATYSEAGESLPQKTRRVPSGENVAPAAFVIPLTIGRAPEPSAFAEMI